MIALSVVACGDDTDDFWGSAVWRTSSTVGAAEGSAAIQIEGPVGAGWRAEIKDGGAWCSFRLNDPTVLVKEGTVQSSNISNILDVYYPRNTGSGERSATIEFEFFGGEPQMNFDVVKQLVEYARSIEKQAGKNFRFTLTTNGMLIDDDVIDFANREMSNVVLSLDGRKEVHDRYRVDYAGKGSWEKIVPKFQKLVEARKGKGYYMRGTFTHANPDFLEDIKVMLDLGFSELSMEPVVTGAGDPAALTEQDKPTVFEQYEQLAELMLKRDDEGKPFTFYHYMIDLAGGPCIYKRISGCGSGTEYMAVTPWGDLYPCHQFVGDDKFLLGNIWTGVTNTAVRDEFAACNVYARKECRDCWARLYCSGGCAANAYHSTGSVRGIYEYGCDLFRKRMECALMVAVAREIKAAESDEANAPA